MPPLPRPQTFTAPDGTPLSYRVFGEGPAVLLLHGFFSSGTANWVHPGHARRVAESGHTVVVPDVRAHGRSGRPTDAAYYPPDVAVDDVLALVDHLGLAGYDAAGYSLGARTITRLLVRGAPIGRAVLAGQGLRALTLPAGEARTSMLRTALGRRDEAEGSPLEQWFAEQWGRRPEEDRAALLGLLGSSVGTSVDEIERVRVPVRVVMGDEDDPAGARELVSVLPGADLVLVPGDHVTAAGRAELGAAVAEFLGGQTGTAAGRTNS